MGNCNWCYPGDHSYPEDQPGATTMTVGRQVRNQWGGYQPANKTITICAACAADMGMTADDDEKGQSPAEVLQSARNQRTQSGGRSPLARAKILINGTYGKDKAKEAEAKGYDPDYVKWLEDQADKQPEYGAAEMDEPL